jgi:K+ transporter
MYDLASHQGARNLIDRKRRARKPHTRTPRQNVAFAIGAVGVVFGDIGTSPLYAMTRSFSAGWRPSNAR